MKNHSVTFLLLVAAIILYAVGLALPAAALLVLGVLAEETVYTNQSSS